MCRWVGDSPTVAGLSEVGGKASLGCPTFDVFFFCHKPLNSDLLTYYTHTLLSQHEGFFLALFPGLPHFLLFGLR